MNPKFKLPYQVLVSVSCSFFYPDLFSPTIKHDNVDDGVSVDDDFTICLIMAHSNEHLVSCPTRFLRSGPHFFWP